MDTRRAMDAENQFFSTFIMKETDKVVGIREHLLSDGNFVLTYFMKRILNENSKLCLVNLHHTLTHYQSIGKRLGFDLVTKIKNAEAIIVEPMKIILEIFSRRDKTNFLGNTLVKNLILDIKKSIDSLNSNKSDGKVYLIIDDVSHLLDLGIELKDVVTFLNCCANFRAILITLTHVSNKTDTILGNALCYLSDVYFDVMPLKTGVSRDVTGILKYVRRIDQSASKQDNENIYHFKALEKEIKFFLPGEAMHLFYK